MGESQLKVDFRKPPVVEVICGITFEEIGGFTTPYVGRLWERVRKGFPNCKEVSPLARIIEPPGSPSPVQFTVQDVPPMPRVWFISADEAAILQVQRDRFLYNWKKARPGDDYPRYPSVFAGFTEHLGVVERFLEEEELGTVSPVQYELTYVNHMPFDRPVSSLGAVGKLFRDLCWSCGERFLPEPENLNWRASFLLPDGMGRLHASLRTAIRSADNAPVLVLDLTARGMPGDRARAAMRAWFDLAHEWIVRGFADLTTEWAHDSLWERLR